MHNKLDRNTAIESIARLLCVIAGIEAVDSTDGRQHWWMFVNDAEKIVADLEKRFPKPPLETKEGKGDAANQRIA